MTTIDPDDVKMCDCSVCFKELLGESMRGVVAAPDADFVAGRVNSRPMCIPCLANRSGRAVMRSIIAER